MSPMTLAVIITIVMIVVLFLGMPIGATLFLAGFVGIWMLYGFDVSAHVMHTEPLTSIIDGDLVAVPLFILIGCFAMSSGLATDGFNVARKWLNKLPGGLGITTIVASAFFAACSGSSVASAVTMGKLSLPEMENAGYDPALRTGIVGAGGLLATMIPPSSTMVLYGLASGESISKLLIGGAIPGVILTLAFCIGLVIVIKMDPKKAPMDPTNYTWAERWKALPQAWGIVAIFGVIFVGVFTGVFTATESAAFGSLIALVLICTKVRGKALWKAIITACKEGADTTVSIFFIVVGAYIFSTFMIMAGLPKTLTELITGADVAPIVVIIIMMASYFVLGMFLDSVSILMITIPIYYPIITALGYDGVWFGVVTVAMKEVGMLTPPFGIVAYAIGSITDVNIMTIFKGCMMYILIEVIVVVLLIAFPQLVLWLPSMMS